MYASAMPAWRGAMPCMIMGTVSSMGVLTVSDSLALGAPLAVLLNTETKTHIKHGFRSKFDTHKKSPVP